MDEFLSENAKKLKSNVETLMREANPQLIDYYEKTDFPWFMVIKINITCCIGR